MKETLADKHPELLVEWLAEKNLTCTPQTVAPKSNKRVWWKCAKCGYEWKTAIAHRTDEKPTGCPECAKKARGNTRSKKAAQGGNSLAEHYPELIKQWNYEKNFPLTPETVAIKSNKKVSWKCDYCGHEWETTISHRASGRNCPNCTKAGTSYAEQAVFYYVSQIFPDAENRSKVNNTELDIYIPSIKTAIEYDGNFYHKNGEEKDNIKDKFCDNEGIKLYRLREKGLPKTKSAVNITCDIRHLDESIKELLEELMPGNKISVDSVAARFEIETKFRQIETEKSVAVLAPHLIEEWHYIKNKSLKPESVRVQSDIKVFWKCKKCGYEWLSTVSHRVSGRGCPYCANQVVIPGKNDLLTLYPEVAKQWDYEKNQNKRPEKYAGKSNKSVWWKCEKCNGSWKAQIGTRTKGVGCPYCSNYSVLVGFNDLDTKNPQLAKQWHPTKNGDLTPQQVTAVTQKKVWWLCDVCGGEWEAQVNSRNDGGGCPYCSGKAVLPGYNDLETKNPQLAKQWHPTKNGDLTPQQVTSGSKKKVWWKCETCGGEWEAVISSRARGNGCPYCSNHKVLLGVNDLETVNPQLAKQWHPTKNGDLTPQQVTSGSNKKVWWKCETCEGEWEAVIDSRAGGVGCPYCSNQKVLPGFNDIVTRYPELMEEWDYAKNVDHDPYKLVGGSRGKVWWKCKKCGYEWEREIVSRTSGRGCPFCANKIVIQGENDLATQYPEIAKQWDYEKNFPKRPEEYAGKSNKKAWWKCEKCNGSWKAVISTRTKGVGCPYCSGSKPLIGVNDLLTIDPELAKQWHPTKNGKLTPQQVKIKSNKKVWWKCHTCGHEWEASVEYRSRGRCCPECKTKLYKTD